MKQVLWNKGKKRDEIMSEGERKEKKNSKKKKKKHKFNYIAVPATRK